MVRSAEGALTTRLACADEACVSPSYTSCLQPPLVPAPHLSSSAASLVYATAHKACGQQKGMPSPFSPCELGQLLRFPLQETSALPTHIAIRWALPHFRLQLIGHCRRPPQKNAVSCL